MDDVGAFGVDDLRQPRGQRPHFQQFPGIGARADTPFGFGVRWNVQLSTVSAGRAPFVVPRSGDLDGIPAKTALRRQNPERAEHVAALQRQ